MSVINAFDHQMPHFERGLRENLLRATHARRRDALRLLYKYRLQITLVAGLALGLAALGLAFTPDAEAPAPTAVLKAAPAPVWTEVARPIPMFSLEAPEFAKTPGQFTMRRHSTGGGREDSLTFGTVVGSEPYFRLVIHQVGAEGAPEQTFFVESARRAAEIGLSVDGLAHIGALGARFGDMEWAEARLASAGKVREGCAAFRLTSDKPNLRLFGLACGADGEALSRKQMSCLIGRLDLVAAGDDLALRDYFVRAELARDATCAASRDRRQTRPASKPAVSSPPAAQPATGQRTTAKH